MFDDSKFRLQLKHLEHNSCKLTKKYLQADKQIKNKGQDDYLELEDMLRQQGDLQTWIKFLQTKHYQQKCNRYGIQMPEKENGNYLKFDFDDGNGEREILTIKGFQILRNSIRQ